jgi:hypothetical protein
VSARRGEMLRSDLPTARNEHGADSLAGSRSDGDSVAWRDPRRARTVFAVIHGWLRDCGVLRDKEQNADAGTIEGGRIECALCRANERDGFSGATAGAERLQTGTFVDGEGYSGKV